MDFSANKQDTYEKRIASLPDQPNMQPNELKAYFDSSPEQLRQAHNGLCDALTEATSNASAAANLGFQRTAGVPADDVQAAVENVQAQLDAAVMGNIPSGSVDGDKLAQDVRDRFAAIESAAASEASTRASTDSSLQKQINTHTTQITSLASAKAEYVTGTYSGNDAAERTISLGFTPSIIIVFDKCGSMTTNGLTTGGFATKSFTPPSSAVATCSDGFRVYYESHGSKMANSSSSNFSPYGYIAFK